MAREPIADVGLDEDPRYKWKVLTSVIFGIFMVILDTTVVNIAFPTLQEEFAAGVNTSQWILSIYVLALGISTPISGYLGDRFGLKRIYLLGLSLFVLGSILSAVAPSLLFLIAARALQGLGGGIALPLGTAMLFKAFPTEEQGTALGIFGIAIVTAPALGPILGGYLVDNASWRWIFLINIPIGIFGVLLGGRFLREHKETLEGGLDWLGLITSTIGFGAVLYAASIAAEQGWGSGQVLGLFALGGVALALFTYIELYVVKEPLLELRLFKDFTFTNAVLVGWVSVVALFGAEFLLPLYLQILRGRTALQTGIILLPLAIASGIMLPLAGRLYDRVGARPLVTVGFGILIVNTWQFARLTEDTSIAWIAVLLLLRGIALGLTVQTTLVAALGTVRPRLYSRGSALINATRQVVQSIAVAFLATILVSAITPGLSGQLEAFQGALPAAVEGEGPVELCALPESDAPIPPQGKEAIAQFCAEYIAGFDQAYTWTFYAAIAAFVLGLFLPGWPLAWSGRQQRTEQG